MAARLIASERLEPFFTCPICMERLRDTRIVVTCGHRFCARCMTTFLQLGQACPVCKGKITEETVAGDHQFNEMSEIFAAELEKGEQRYFADLARSISTDAADDAGAGAAAKPPAPRPLAAVEHVFRTRLRDSLASFAQLADTAARRAEAARERIRSEHAAACPGCSPTCAETIEKQLRAVDGVLAANSQALADALDRHLATSIPRPHTLPVNVVVLVVPLQHRIAAVAVHAADTCADIKKAVLARLRDEEMKIVVTDETADFEVVQPLAEPVRVGAACMPVVELGLLPGSELRLLGGVGRQGESCFADTFATNPTLPMDYFRCNDCNLNWVCAGCAGACHRGHSISGFMKQHVAKWACCYCPRKGACSLRRLPPA